MHFPNHLHRWQGNPSSSSADVNLRWKTRAMDSKAVGDGSDVTINTDGSFTVQPGVYDIQGLSGEVVFV